MIAKWYEITPMDTLFFRGARPMESGQEAAETFFPPPVSVILGALRTAVLKQKGISFSVFKDGKTDETINIIKLIGSWGNPAPFSVAAVLLKKDKNIYTTAPANWFVDRSKDITEVGDLAGLNICSAKTAVAKKMNITNSSDNIPIMPADRVAVPLMGYWVDLKFLLEWYEKTDTTISHGDILSTKDFFNTEKRIGIGLNADKQTNEGKIYSADHIRLKEQVTILIGIDKDIGLANNGIISFGGEQRVCGYNCLSEKEVPQLAIVKSDKYLSLAPLELTNEILGKIVCAQKPVIISGWDMAKRSPKPTTSWLPAGTVFNSNINDNLVPLAQIKRGDVK